MKWPRRALIATLVAAGLITALWWEENWRGQRIWEESCARLRAAGHPVEIHEVIPPPLPDELNVAMAPVFAELFATEDVAATRLGPIASEWKARGAYGLEVIPGSRPMSRTDLSQVNRWATFLRECFPSAAEPVAAENPADEVLRFYAKWETEWNEIRTALERPHCRLPLEYDKGIERPVRHLQPFLKLTNNSRGWIAALAAKNDAEAYTRLLLTLMKLERCIGENPESLISHLVACTMTTVTLRAWQHSLPLVILDESQLSRLQAQLERISLAEAQQAFRRELVSIMHSYRQFSDRDLTEFIRQSGAMHRRWPNQVRTVEDWVFDTALTTRPNGWRLGDLSSLQNGLRASGVGCVDTLRGTVNKAKIDAMGPDAHRFAATLGWYSYSRHALPDTVRTSAQLLKRTAFTHAMIRCAMVWCAAERFRLKTGRLAHSQDELVPNFLKAVLVDPVEGGPLRLVHQSDGGYVIYSPGWDGKDDGGVRGRKWQEGDWGWASNPMTIESPDDIRKWAEEDKDREEQANRPLTSKKTRVARKHPPPATPAAP